MTDANLGWVWQPTPDTSAIYELYDLSKDPGETKDLARERPDVVARMKGIIGEAHVPNPDFRLFR